MRRWTSIPRKLSFSECSPSSMPRPSSASSSLAARTAFLAVGGGRCRDALLRPCPVGGGNHPRNHPVGRQEQREDQRRADHLHLQHRAGFRPWRLTAGTHPPLPGHLGRPAPAARRERRRGLKAACATAMPSSCRASCAAALWASTTSGAAVAKTSGNRPSRTSTTP